MPRTYRAADYTIEGPHACTIEQIGDGSYPTVWRVECDTCPYINTYEWTRENAVRATASHAEVAARHHSSTSQ